MSCLELYKRNFRNHTAVHNPESSKLVTEDNVVNGICVTDYSFKTNNVADDPRQSLKYQDLCLGNLQRLGVTSQLKNVMLQRNDVDLVIEQIERNHESKTPEVPAQTPQA